MLWQLIEEENKKKKKREGPHEMKMTPGTYCLHFQLSHTAGYSHFSQTYSSISSIMWMFL